MSKSHVVSAHNTMSSKYINTGKTSKTKVTLSAKDKHAKKKVSVSLDTVDESRPPSPRPPSKPRERRGAVDSMMRSGNT